MVLVYHGVRAPSDPPGLFPPRLERSLFAAPLDHLAANYDVVALSELTDAGAGYRAGARPRIALTFDDDLRGLVTEAAPLLRERKLPATFFLTGSSLEGEFNEWWNDLEAIVARGPDAWSAATGELAATWPWVDGASPAAIANTVTGLSATARAELASALRELSAGAGADPGIGARQVAGLASDGFEVGFHTLRHHPLDTLDDAQLELAMSEGLDELARAAGRRPASIAYPHGRADLRVAAAAAAAGFRRGFVMGADRAIRDTDPPLLLPRIDPYSGSLAVEAYGFRLARTAFAAARGAAS
jgi:peptidoglycan/xylan/chitin deacetylase (PgdA/CDA1 family)